MVIEMALSYFFKPLCAVARSKDRTFTGCLTNKFLIGGGLGDKGSVCGVVITVF